MRHDFVQCAKYSCVSFSEYGNIHCDICGLSKELCIKNNGGGYLQEMSETANSRKKDIPASLVNFEVALDDYFLEIKKAVLQKAKEKGYYTQGEDSGRNLYDFIAKYATGHGIGEIIYKAIRWTRKRDPEDLVKIAAWAFLEWDYNRRNPVTVANICRKLNSE